MQVRRGPGAAAARADRVCLLTNSEQLETRAALALGGQLLHAKMINFPLWFTVQPLVGHILLDAGRHDMDFRVVLYLNIHPRDHL